MIWKTSFLISGIRVVVPKSNENGKHSCQISSLFVAVVRPCLYSFISSHNAHTKRHFIWHKIWHTWENSWAWNQYRSTYWLCTALHCIRLHSDVLFLEKSFNGRRMGLLTTETTSAAIIQSEWSKREREFIFSFAWNLCAWYTRYGSGTAAQIVLYFIVNWTARTLCRAMQFSLIHSIRTWLGSSMIVVMNLCTVHRMRVHATSLLCCHIQFSKCANARTP